MILFAGWGATAGKAAKNILKATDAFGTVAKHADEAIDVGEALLKNADVFDNIAEGLGDSVSLYRAVGPNEFYDLFDVMQFRTVGKSLDAKQFGLDFDETLKFADWTPNAAAIIEVQIPESILKDIGDFTPVDPHIFKNGNVTIPGNQLDTFKKHITDLFHVF
jgi:hypothetical protein